MLQYPTITEIQVFLKVLTSSDSAWRIFIVLNLASTQLLKFSQGCQDMGFGVQLEEIPS